MLAHSLEKTAKESSAFAATCTKTLNAINRRTGELICKIIDKKFERHLESGINPSLYQEILKTGTEFLRQILNPDQRQDFSEMNLYNKRSIETVHKIESLEEKKEMAKKCIDCFSPQEKQMLLQKLFTEPVLPVLDFIISQNQAVDVNLDLNLNVKKLGEINLNDL